MSIVDLLRSVPRQATSTQSARLARMRPIASPAERHRADGAYLTDTRRHAIVMRIRG
jgi:hypothetical protein